MSTLDPMTIERLVQIIVDPGGPYERAGWQLQRLLEHAGWPDPPEYDGSYRVPWLTEVLLERKHDRVAIERLICRVCDPLEYDEGLPAAERIRTSVNEKLTPEGLAVSYVGERPVIGELLADGSGSAFTEPPELEKRIEALLRDADVARALNRRVRETRICERSGAHTMAVIGIGSVVEGLLFTLLTERDPEAAAHKFVGRDGQPVTSAKPSLEMLINTAYARGWIQLDAKTFTHTVRDFRNYVHPRREFAERPEFDADSVRLCWAPVHAMLNDLETKLGR